jgi:hypothetical protein
MYRDKHAVRELVVSLTRALSYHGARWKVGAIFEDWRVSVIVRHLPV